MKEGFQLVSALGTPGSSLLCFRGVVRDQQHLFPSPQRGILKLILAARHISSFGKD